MDIWFLNLELRSVLMDWLVLSKKVKWWSDYLRCFGGGFWKPTVLLNINISYCII